MTYTLHLNSGAQGVETKIYKDILPDENVDDRAYVDIMNKVHPYTMTMVSGAEPTYALFQAIKYVVQNRIPGEIVECGVWRGGSMMLIAYALQHFGAVDRDLYLYDTFAGMTEPGDIDVDFDGKPMRPVWKEAASEGAVIGFGGTLEKVKANLALTGYPDARMKFIVGDVMQTIPASMPSRIACLRLDTDWYESTRHELLHMYPLIVPNGVLIVDDYGWCRGARQATDEFFGDQPFKPMMNRVDQSVRVVVKSA